MFSTTLLIGRLGADPEIKTVNSKDTICTFSVATTGKWISHDGESKEKITWHRVICWNKLADLCAQYLSKGRLVLVEGEIIHNNWTDEKGDKHYSSEIKAKRVLFLDSSSEKHLSTS
jgi:single-strand DNA-binding protein